MSTEKPDYLPAMSAIAREAGALLMQYFDRNIKIEYKGEAIWLRRRTGNRRR